MIGAKIVRALLPSWRERRIAACDERMLQAKRAMSLAALSCMRGDADATEKTRTALALVEAARLELARIADDALDALPAADLARLSRKP